MITIGVIDMVQKRYEYYSKDGIQWTPWFNYNGPQEPWQLKNRLKNEYRTVTNEQQS